ncbi:hypothetical protein [Legionella fairfieldensis]|uniref:hypothetical protein n=1 Tax=Legionella fairfieldensis TaxID=45064 RepID=UPI00048DA872|nr:hypothetical protein [Legionella fairfieldensis]
MFRHDLSQKAISNKDHNQKSPKQALPMFPSIPHKEEELINQSETKLPVELKTLFGTKYQEKPFKAIVAGVDKRKPITRDCEVTRYPLSQIISLITLTQEIDQNRSKQSDEIKLRFLVDSQYQLWCAPEGVANNSTIPAHWKLTFQPRTSAICLAAGDLTFITQNNQWILKEINNKSGDFQPDFSALILPLGIIALHENLPFQLSEIIELEEQGKTRIQSHWINFKQVEEQLGDFFDEETKDKLGKQGKAEEKHIYKPEPERGAKRPAFFGKKPDEEDKKPSRRRLEMK